jgi:hypothetical protein
VGGVVSRARRARDPTRPPDAPRPVALGGRRDRCRGPVRRGPTWRGRSLAIPPSAAHMASVSSVRRETLAKRTSRRARAERCAAASSSALPLPRGRGGRRRDPFASAAHVSPGTGTTDRHDHVTRHPR